VNNRKLLNIEKEESDTSSFGLIGVDPRFFRSENPYVIYVNNLDLYRQLEVTKKGKPDRYVAITRAQLTIA